MKNDNYDPGKTLEQLLTNTTNKQLKNYLQQDFQTFNQEYNCESKYWVYNSICWFNKNSCKKTN